MTNEKKRQRANLDENPEAIIARVLETQLAGRIATIIEQQAERAVKKTANSYVDAGGSASTSDGVGIDEDRRLKNELKAASSIAEFDPEDKDSNIDRWLSIIDHLGEVYGWSDHEKSYFMPMKLRGAARMWLNKRDSFQLTWSEWKASLKKAYRKQHDFAVCLEELVDRRKLADETMTRYFQAKLALCGRVGIDGEKAVSCIIRGLPEELRGNAYACRCQTPEMLYLQFLAGLEHYKSPRAMGRASRRGESYFAKARRSSPGPVEAKRQVTEGFRRVRCYNCQEYGTHLSRDCPRPRQERCSYCGEVGHFFEECPKRGR